MTSLSNILVVWTVFEASHFYKYFAVAVGLAPFQLILVGMVLKSAIILSILVTPFGLKINIEDLKVFLVSFGLLTVFPVLQGAYFGYLDLASSAKWINYWTTFYGMYLVAKNCRPSLRFLFKLFVITTVLGIVISYAQGNWFYNMIRLMEARVSENGRALGFYGQPNTLGISCVFALIFGFLFRENYSRFRAGEIIFVILLSICLVLTGSRIAIGFAIVVFYVFFSESRIGINRQTLFLFFGIVSVIVVSVFFMRFFGSGADVKSDDNAIARLAFVVGVLSGDLGLLQSDKSVFLRISTMIDYISLFGQRFFFGWGVGSEVFLKEQGVIELHSHSSVLSILLEFGMLGGGILAASFWLIFSRLRKRFFLGKSRAIFIVACLVGLAFLSSAVFFNIFYLVSGAIIGARVSIGLALTSRAKLSPGSI